MVRLAISLYFCAASFLMATVMVGLSMMDSSRLDISDLVSACVIGILAICLARI